jgi:HEAT repeat protein
MRTTTILCCGLILIQCQCQTACRRQAAKAGGPAAVDPDCPPPKNLSAAARSSTVPELVKQLASSKTDDRYHAAYTLAEYGCAAAPAVPALTRALKDPSSNVRRRAAIALGRIGPRATSAAPALIATLQDSDPPTRPEAARALAKIGPEAVRQTVARIVRKDYPDDIKTMTARVLITEWPTVVPGLLRCLEDRKDSRLRSSAVLFLGSMYSRASSATPELLEQAVRGLTHTLAADPDPDVRARSAAALSHLQVGQDLLGTGSDDEGVYQLIQQDREPMPTAARALARAIGDPDAEVRSAAVSALGSYYSGHKAVVVAAWQRATKDPDKEVSSWARRELRSARFHDELERKARGEREKAEKR